MRKLRVYLRGVSKFLKMLKDIRTRHAQGVMKYKLLRIYKKWKIIQYNVKREIVLNTSEGILMNTIIFSMMAKWKFKVGVI